MLVVFKPNSSRVAQAHIDWLKKEEKKRQHVFSWYATQGDFQGDCQAISCLSESHAQVVVVGGDGTLHLVLNALHGTKKRVALLPAGTGNDFARQFAWSTPQWRKAVFASATRTLDLGKIHCQDSIRWFHNIGGIGFNAAVVEHLKMSQKRHPLSYVTAGLKQIGFFNGVECDIKDHGRARHLMLVVSNGRYFAAGLSPTPKGSNQDGLFDVVAMKGWRLRQRVVIFLAMLLGSQHERLAYVDSWQSDRVEIETAGLAIEADGELVGVTPAQFECSQGALLLAVCD